MSEWGVLQRPWSVKSMIQACSSVSECTMCSRLWSVQAVCFSSRAACLNVAPPALNLLPLPANLKSPLKNQEIFRKKSKKKSLRNPIHLFKCCHTCFKSPCLALFYNMSVILSWNKYWLIDWLIARQLAQRIKPGFAEGSWQGWCSNMQFKQSWLITKWSPACYLKPWLSDYANWSSHD